MSSAAICALESTASAGRVLGRRVVHLAETTSTMDEAWGWAAAAEPEGLVVVADMQTAGRGRHGRSWSSQAGRDLLLSIVVRPRVAFSHELLVMASLACARVARSNTGRDATIKWPNDVRCDGRKLAGILAESQQQSDGLVAVVGIGLNVNTDRSVAYDAPGSTSLKELAGGELDRAEVLGQLLDEMDGMYRSLASGATLVPEWRGALETIGQRVTVSSVDPRSPGVIVEGLAKDVDEHGRLLVEADDGMMRAVSAGEVTLRT